MQEAFKIKNNLQKGINHTIAVYKREVNEFEKNFGKNGKRLHELEKLNSNQVPLPQINNTSEIANANISSILPPNNLNISMQKNTFGSAPLYESVENRSSKITDKIYNKMMRDTKTKMERNRRRRKIIVEQGKAQLEIENKRREEQYISKLGKQSNQEKQLTYETNRVNQSKNINKENRNLREEMYKKRDEQNVEFEKINEENFLKYNIESFKKDMEKEDGKKSDLELSQKQKKRNANNKYCEDMVKLIIDITDKAYEYQQINDVEEVDDRVWSGTICLKIIKAF